ncbi:hypothetical protein T459_30126 [Capsicum annuum]|uniref:Uncharacterized protein n=1 Tax=Capsicum annuum TaxID=4072 RepID=A0A2G2Y821_CAPAN|nr:hypothetical protein FXO37_08153 [Capsicum annuum]PHT65701.1 hypothetical protein T459_30126 [Capsicum annuum]
MRLSKFLGKLLPCDESDLVEKRCHSVLQNRYGLSVRKKVYSKVDFPFGRNSEKIFGNSYATNTNSRLKTGLCRRNLRRRKSTMEAISENFIKVVPKKTVKFKVQSVVTIRNKNNEDTKKKIVIHLVAFTNKIRRNVALELISTEIDSIIDMKKLVEIRDGHDDAA